MLWFYTFWRSLDGLTLEHQSSPLPQIALFPRKVWARRPSSAGWFGDEFYASIDVTGFKWESAGIDNARSHRRNADQEHGRSPELSRGGKSGVSLIDKVI